MKECGELKLEGSDQWFSASDLPEGFWSLTNTEQRQYLVARFPRIEQANNGKTGSNLIAVDFTAS